MADETRMTARSFLPMLSIAVMSLSGCVKPGTGTQLPDRLPVEFVGLPGSEWQLVEFRSNDDAQGVSRPADPEGYSLRFNEDGTANFGLDCNRGNANWNASNDGRATSGQLTFSDLASTRAMCPPPSMGETLARDTQYMRSYLLRDDMLYIDLIADGGTYVWEPSAR